MLVPTLLALLPALWAPPPVSFCGETLPVIETRITCYAGRTPSAQSQVPLDLSPLRRLPGLEVLSIASGEIEFILPRRIDDLGPLAALGRLRELTLGHTTARDLRPLAGLKRLEGLSLHASPVHDLTPLRGLLRLARLNLSGTAVVDLRPLMALPLRELDLGRTKVRDLRPLFGISTLERLGLDPDFDPEALAAFRAVQPQVTVYRGTQY